VFPAQKGLSSMQGRRDALAAEKTALRVIRLNSA
jgi:hypothetical protein